jgi:hypothetical protein
MLAKVALIGVFVFDIRHSVVASRAYFRAPNELTGVWNVTSFAGSSNEERWCKLIVFEWGVRAKNCAESGDPMRAEVLPAAQAILVRDEDTSELWRYHRDGDQLVVDAGARHVTLARAPAPLLKTRGFHWVQEFPFNR